MITDGQDVSAAVTNAAFVSKTANSTVTGAITLSKPTGSGAVVADTQAAINDGITHAAATAAHGATGAVVGTTNTQALTNKDYDGGTASNTSRITLPKAAKTTLDALTRKQGTLLFDTTTNKPYYDDGTNLQLVGSGSGGAVNLISNPDAEAGTTGWATFKDASGTRPVDGTGGTALYTTFTTTSTAPLNGTNSFLISKSANDARGEGVSYDFNLPLEFRGKALTASVPYIVNSGTFVAGTSSNDSDVIGYFYDITNSKLVEPSSFKFLSNSTTVSDKLQATVQFDSNCTSARFILYVASTSASAYELKLDDISVGPANYQYGTPVTDWTSFTPTGSWVTNTTYTGKWRRVGDSAEIITLLNLTGAPTATSLTINLPSGMSIDTSKILTAGSDQTSFGIGTVLRSAVASYPLGEVGYNSSTSVLLQAINASGTFATNSVVNATVPATFANGDTVHISYRVPILGWSSSVQTSDQTDTRVISTKVYKTSQTGVNPNNSTVQLTLDSTVYDKSGMFSSASGGRLIIQTPGVYKVTYGTMVSGTNVLANDYYLVLQKNGTTTGFAPYYRGIASTAFSMGFSDEIELIAGDILTIGLLGGGNNSVSTLTTYNQLTATRISGPSAIAANETIYAEYSTAAGQSLTNNTVVLLDFGTKIQDTHGAVTTGGSWKFTAPISGVYNISSDTTINFGTSISIQYYGIYIYKNGNQLKAGPYLASVTPAAGSGIAGAGINTSIRLLAGDYIDIRLVVNSGAGRTLTTSGAENYVSITRTGN